MKMVLTAPFLFAIALATTSVDLSAQVRRNPVPPVRGVNRPLGIPPLGRNRPMGPNQVKKQQLQQRLMQAIGLSSDQRMRMQEIRRSHVDELAAAGRRLRQSRQALDQAIMSEPYSEADVRRATEALAAAQADKIRIDATVRTQVRGILTSDQVQRFHQLQREMRREMKDQEQRNQDREQGLNRLTTPGTPTTDTESGEIDLLSLVFPLR
jgi:Spy/CpxP family protein refolding chaperone